MVCCVSGGSGDSSNVGVIYRPLDKQASLPQPVNMGPNDCSESGVWGSSAALKSTPHGPLSQMRVFIRGLFHSGLNYRLRENEQYEV